MAYFTFTVTDTPATLTYEGCQQLAFVERQETSGDWVNAGAVGGPEKSLDILIPGDYRVELRPEACCEVQPSFIVTNPDVPTAEYTGMSITPAYDVYPGKGADCETAEISETFVPSNNYTGISFSVSGQTPVPEGLTYGGGFLWVQSQAPPQQTFQYDGAGTYTGTSFFTVSANTDPKSGVAWDGTFFWVLGSSLVYQHDAVGDYTTFSFSHGISGAEGIDSDGTNIWIVAPGAVTVFNTSGGVVGGFAIPEVDTPQGIADDGTHLWIVGTTLGIPGVWKYDHAGNLIDYFRVTVDDNPTGIAWDGTYLWILGRLTDTVYQFNPGTAASGLVTYTKTVDSGNGDFEVIYELSDQATSDLFLATMAAIGGSQNRTVFSVAGNFMHPRQVDSYVQDGVFVTVQWDHTNIEEDTPDPLILPCVDPVSDNNYDTSNDALRGFYETIPLDTPQTPTQDFTYTITQYVATGLECDEIKQVELSKSDGSVEPGGYINPDGSVHELKGTPSLSCPLGTDELIVSEILADIDLDGDGFIDAECASVQKIETINTVSHQTVIGPTYRYLGAEIEPEKLYYPSIACCGLPDFYEIYGVPYRPGFTPVAITNSENGETNYSMTVSGSTLPVWIDDEGNATESTTFQKTYTDASQRPVICYVPDGEGVRLDCSNEEVDALDLSLGASITELYTNTNNLLSVDISQITTLLDLRCAANSISILGTTQNPALHTLYCYGNNSIDLDLIANALLSTLWCHNCNLTSAEVDSVLVAMDNHGTSNGEIRIEGTNAAPGTDGCDAKANLELRGWTVTVTTGGPC